MPGPSKFGTLKAKRLILKDQDVMTAMLLAVDAVADLNGEKLVIDVDADTYLRMTGGPSGTDDSVDFYVAGAADFRLVANVFRALSGSSVETDTINETTSAAGVTIDSLLIKDQTLQAHKRNVIAKTSNFTASAADSGCIYEIGAADLVVTLPATAPGLHWRFQLATAGLSSGTGLSISPAAADKIMGNGFTSADNKDAILAGSGDREGDWIEICGDAAGNGWLIEGVSGTWTREA